MGYRSARCTALASPDYVNFAVSIFLLLGILVSYLVQHIRIVSRRSSEGISPYFVLLGFTSGTCAVANILVLPTSRADFACCNQISGLACFSGILGVLQLGMQWTCFAVILLLFLLFFPHASALAPPKPPSSQPSYRTALAITTICVVHLLTTIVLSFSLVASAPQSLQTYASILGVLATILAGVQYLPQLYTTYRLKTVGSLSLPMMCLQTPGSFLWAGSLAARLGWEGWSTWGILVVTGLLQGCVLTMGIVYELRIWRMRKESGGNRVDGEGEDDQDEAVLADERTPLVGNGHG